MRLLLLLSAICCVLQLRVPQTAAGACDDKDPTVSQLKPTDAIGPIVFTAPTSDPLPLGGGDFIQPSGCGFNGSGPFILADGALTGTFNFSLNFSSQPPSGGPVDCTTGQIVCRIENADGSTSYALTTAPSPCPASPPQNPNQQGQYTVSGSCVIHGTLADAMLSVGSVKLKDLWFRAYWQCTSPAGPLQKIYEVKLLKP